MKETNNKNVFIIIKNEIVLFFKSIFNGLTIVIKYGPYSILYVLSTIAIFIDDKFWGTINGVRYIFKKIIATIINKIENSKLVVNYRKKQESKLRVLTIDKINKKKSKRKVIYEYLVRYPGKELTKGYYSDYSELGVYQYLAKKGYVVYSIKTGKWIEFLNRNISYLNDEIEQEDMLKWLSHLDISLKKNISTRDAFMVIAKNNKKKKYQELLDNILKCLIKGDKLSEAFSKQGNSFPEELINILRKAEYNDKIPEALDEYLDDKYKELSESMPAEPSDSSALLFILIIGFVLYEAIQYFVFNNDSPLNINLNFIDFSNINTSLLSIIEFLKGHYIIVILIVFILIAIL